MGQFNLEKVIGDVFAPSKSDVVTFFIDIPHGDIKEIENWTKRREMARVWREGFINASQKFGYKVNPLVEYKATGANNSDLPIVCTVNGEEKPLEEVVAKTTLAIVMSQFSATAPMAMFTKKYDKLRVASMPGVVREMEDTALSADYAEVAKISHKLLEVLEGAVGGTVKFSTGHHCYFDLRHRKGKADDGQLPPDKQGFRLINFPSGETFIVPYEGEKGEKSATRGELPVSFGGDIVVFKVKENRVFDVAGTNPEAVSKQKNYLNVDDARRNIAEFGLGCNKEAVMRNLIIEDEKAAFHWALGRSEHIGGVTDVKSFSNPANVIHQDFIYAKGSPITVSDIKIHYTDGRERQIWDGNWYTL